MLEELKVLHREVQKNTPLAVRRYLYDIINWEARALCIFGDRGVGKTTLMCQFLNDRYPSTDQGLYLSADNVNVIGYGLFNIAKEYFSLGGEALFIDEVHKYPNWSVEIKNILDVYKSKQVIFSGSSAIDLKKSKGDLSRRVVYHELHGLSFREFLNLTTELQVQAVTLEEILTTHGAFAESLMDIPIKKHFQEYLLGGYYPYFLEDKACYLSKLNNVIEKVIFEDIAVIEELRQPTLPSMKQLVWLIATSQGLIPNVQRISKNLRLSRPVVTNYLEYLDRAGLIRNLHPEARGMKLARKPAKILMDNTNLLHAINGTLKLDPDAGGVRETFFVNQVAAGHRVAYHDHGDFLVDGEVVIEVGGPNKDRSQIKNQEDAYLAIDGIEIGAGNRIPLHLFGLLY